MAMGNVFGNLKEKMRSIYNNFFYDGAAQQPAPEGMYQPEQQPYPPQQEYPPQQAVYQQEQPAYQQPQQPMGGYHPQQNAPFQQGTFQKPKVVDFAQYQQSQQGAYQPQPQQPMGSYQPQQNAPFQQPQEQFRPQDQFQPQGSYQQPQQPQQAPQVPVKLNTRVINGRGMTECRSAINLLRDGDAVVMVLENVTDPSELRRLVDTLSGACYSLEATITKVSRNGVYLMAPKSVAVYADPTTNQMNNPGRTAARGYQAAYGSAQRPYQAQQQPAPQGFTQRTAQVEEPPQNFYARTAPQPAPSPSFSAQPTGYGYAPDQMEAAVDQ